MQEIILACCVLHNFLKVELSSTIQDEDIDANYIFKFGLSRQSGNRAKNACISVREEFKEYFMNKGAVSWQYDRT